MKRQTTSILGLGLFVVCAWLAAVGSAGATAVRLHVDPAFNASGTLYPTDPDLGWSADVQFDIAASCLAGSAGFCTGTLDSATGTLYDTNGTLTTSDDTLLATFSYVSTPDPNLVPFDIQAAVDGSSHVTGVNTLLGYHSVNAGDLSPSFPDFSGNLWVEFYTGNIGNSANLIIQALCPPILELFSDSWYECEPGTICVPDPNGPGAFRSVDASYTITVVPEPEILWLVFAGLGAGWLTRRRRQSH